ncbi:hypothetical protein SCHPADRAFT_657629 [Schizopora paradoxa]|uniref:Uncharacterized protein n=1 Tax=Schizopora paradoxa TaxID=27342 RepID=A0A0H2R7A0_9AGAM|nr:hypothetical protein SCHPADRAFT_657629 [Schizopora paradoxa]
MNNWVGCMGLTEKQCQLFEQTSANNASASQSPITHSLISLIPCAATIISRQSAIMYGSDAYHNTVIITSNAKGLHLDKLSLVHTSWWPVVGQQAHTSLCHSKHNSLAQRSLSYIYMTPKFARSPHRLLLLRVARVHPLQSYLYFAVQCRSLLSPLS